MTFTDHQGREIKLRPTSSAAMEIETALGGLDALRLKLAAGGAPGTRALTFASSACSSRRACARPARSGSTRPRRPSSPSIAVGIGCVSRSPRSCERWWDGGKLREDDLKNAASSNGSLGVVETASAMFEEIAAATRSDDTSA